MPTPLPFSIRQSIKTYSAFYQKVWITCAGIPRGETRTYGWIAQQIGQPRAARAVGQALAANPFAPMIPCHRVLGANGQLTGYTAPGGLTKKAQLLAKERTAVARQSRRQQALAAARRRA